MAVVITGGTGAIGSALAEIFSADSDVAIIYKSSEDKARELSKRLGCKCYRADVSSREEVSTAVSSIISDFGKIDVLINNAGISQIKLFSDIS